MVTPRNLNVQNFTRSFEEIIFKIWKWITFGVFYLIVKPFSTPKIVTGISNLQDEKLSGPLIISSNHDGRIDPVWIFYMIQIHSKIKPNIRFLAWYRFYDMPVLGWYIKAMQCFRLESRKGLEVLDPAVDYLQNSGVLCLFPEGYIKKITEKQKRAKRGVGYLILKTNAPVLPVYIKYHKRSWLPFYWVEIHFGKIRNNLGQGRAEQDIQSIADTVLQLSYDLKVTQGR
jgi:1-acyl-sn-glycerol-3-phosphate acyltransferase